MAEPQGDKDHRDDVTAETAPDLDETMPHEPVAEEDGAKEDGATGDETVIRDATTAMPPAAATTPPWAGRAGVPQPPDALRDSTPYSQAGPPPPTQTWWTPVLLGMLALGLVGVVVLVAWFMGRDVSPGPGQIATTPAVAPTTPAAKATTPTAKATATPPAQLVRVPNNIVGMTQSEAIAALEQIGLNYRFEFARSAEPEDVVIAARPGPGEFAPAQSTVTLVISLGPAPSRSPSPSPSP